MVNGEEEAFAGKKVAVAFPGGHDKYIAQVELGVMAQQFFFNGDGRAHGFFWKFHQHGDGTEVMSAGYMGFIIGSKHFSVPEDLGVGADCGEDKGILLGVASKRHRHMDAYPLSSGKTC